MECEEEERICLLGPRSLPVLAGTGVDDGVGRDGVDRPPGRGEANKEADNNLQAKRNTPIGGQRTTVARRSKIRQNRRRATLHTYSSKKCPPPTPPPDRVRTMRELL